MTWVCFTHKCHDAHGNDVISLIQAVTGYNFMGAVKWLKRLVGDIDTEANYIASKREREMQAFVEEHGQGAQRPRSVNDHSLQDFKPLRSNYFIKKGFKPETLDYFEIAGGWKDSQNLIRDIIPIRDDRGKLVAYSLRDIRLNVDDEDYKYILTPGFNKQNCLYNLHRAQDLGADKPIIVVEGFKSVWRLHELGIDNVVAVMGSEVTEGQRFLLCMYALKGVVLFFDNDSAGVEGTNKAIAELSKQMTVRPVFIQEVDENGKGLDPADLSDELIYEYLNTYY
jgi:DNA primase